MILLHCWKLTDYLVPFSDGMFCWIISFQIGAAAVEGPQKLALDLRY